MLKGAPEVVRTFLATVPSDYDATYKRFAAQVSGLQYRIKSFYTISFAHMKLCCATALRPSLPAACAQRRSQVQRKPLPRAQLTTAHNPLQGARVIALARRALPPSLDGPELRGMGREAAEAEMQFMGFAVFQVCACAQTCASV